MDRPTFLTKIRLPQRRSDILRRSRLVDFLHQQVDKRLIILCAAAGYGKTTLLTDFAHDVDLPVCWYSMDRSDADPRTFFDYMLLSLRQRFPAFGAQTETLLNSVDDVGREVNSIVASLANEIQTDIPDYFVLVLDDYHCVEESEVVNSALDLLIYYLPDNCHLVISTRTLPHFTFSRLAAQRQVAGLGTTDLRFTTDELSKLLRENYKLAMPANQAEEMIDASEGWITGILLTTHTLWMGLVESLIKAKGAASPLFDYLANEAYLQQPREVQRFLLASSVLPQMSPELCDRLYPEISADEMVQYLMRTNLFITELEGPGRWYSYHNLFREFLQAKLKTEDAKLHATLHSKAGQLAEEAKEWDWALRHYGEAGDSVASVELVERVGESLMSSGHWQTLYRWMDSLPLTAIDSRPKLSFYRGRTHIWAGELDQAVANLDRAAQRYREVGDPFSAGGAFTFKSMALRYKGRLPEALDACTQALELQTDPNSRVAAEAHRDIGICMASLGKLVEAERELQKGLEIYDLLGDEAGIATLCQSLGVLAVRKGDLARGTSFYQRALAAWQRLGDTASTAHVLNCIALVHYYTGEYPQALVMLEDALARARQGGRLRIEALILGSLGDVRRDMGNLQGALEAYESALDTAHKVDEVPLVNYLLDAMANTQRIQGDYATAERLLRQAIQQAEDGQSPYEVATYQISAGALAEEQGDQERALELLRSALERLAGSGARRDLARARYHLARTLFAAQDEDGAKEELEGCLELCRQLGYDAFMVSEGQRAQPLISWALARGIGGRRLELVAERLQMARLPVSPINRRPKIRMEPSGPERIEVYALGPARVLVDSRLVTSSDWAVEKTKELFFFLLQQTHGLRKEQIVDDVWPEVEMGKSDSQFHSTMYRLRRALFPQCVTYKDARYQINLGKALWCDADEFVRLIGEAEQPEVERPKSIARYQAALALYRGGFLEGSYCDWAIPKREELEIRSLQATTRLARLLAQSGALGQAMELLRSAVALDPFREESHYSLIHYAALMGDRAVALSHYQSYVKLLKDELGAGPSAVFLDLADRIARGQSVPSL